MQGLTTKRGEIEAKSFVIKDSTRKSFGTMYLLKRGEDE